MLNFFPKKKYTLALVFINAIWFVFFSVQFQHNYQRTSGFLFAEGGETSTYFQPLENLIDSKGYSWTTSQNRFGDFAAVPSTRRMPGIGAVYLPLRLALSEVTALDALISVQWTFHIIAWILLVGAISSYFEEGSPKIIWSLVLLSSVSTFDKVFNNIGLAESLSNSSLIVAFSLLVFYFLKNRSNLLFFAGIFAAWSVFLRPATGIFWALCCIALFIPQFLKKELFNGVKTTFLYSLPLLIFLTLWSLRNYDQTGEVVILEDDIFESMPAKYTPVRKSIRTVILKNGERYEHWLDGSFGQFIYSSGESEKQVNEFMWNEESSALMIEMKNLYIESTLTENRDQITALDNKSKLLMDEILSKMKKERPFHYYILNPLSHLRDLVHKKFYSYLPFPELSQMSIFQKGIKVWEALFHYLLVLSFISLVVLKRKSTSNPILFLTIAFPSTYLITMSIFFGAAEPRYLVSIYPFLIISLFFLIWTKELNFRNHEYKPHEKKNSA